MIVCCMRAHGDVGSLIQSALHTQIPLICLTVFPAPLAPTISVRGLWNSITVLFSGLKLLMPCTKSFSIVHIAVLDQLARSA